MDTALPEDKAARLKQKEDFYRRLDLLSEASDEEDYARELLQARDLLRKSLQPRPQGPSSFPPSSSQPKVPTAFTVSKPPASVSKLVDQLLPSAALQTPKPRKQPPEPPKKVPSLRCAATAPDASVIKETPLQLTRKTSLLRYQTTSPAEASFLDKEIFVVEETPIMKPPPERSILTPNIGSVFMKNSSGIASMLNNNKAQKRKRKEVKVKMVAENKRIFKGQTFFFFPNDIVAGPRRQRIEAAQRYGATWTKEWIPSITHVVLDKDLRHSDLMEFARSILKADMLPPNIILVNEDYPVHCIDFGFLLDPNQELYAIPKQATRSQEVAAAQESSVRSDESLNVKPGRPKKKDIVSEEQTPPRTQEDTQESIVQEADQPSQGTWLPGDALRQPPIENPAEISVANIQGFGSGSDELDEMIQLAKQVKHLPIDDEDEDEDESRPSSSDEIEDSGSSDEERARNSTRARRPVKKGGFNQEGFTCMHGSTINPESNPNERTIRILTEMADHYAKIRVEWKPQAYRKVVHQLKKQSRSISTYEEAIALPFVGTRLAEKIVEIVRTGRLERLENAKADPMDQLLDSFLKIYGVGIDQASRWIQAGYRTLDDLKTKAKLTDNQRLSINHYDDFNTKIPRAQVTALGDIVKKAVAEIDPRVECTIMGSYRRGAAQSGDIDLLLTRASTTSSEDLMPMLNELISTLTKSGFLVAALAKPRDFNPYFNHKSKAGPTPKSGSKWHGCCVLLGNPIWRRIDFLLVPETEMGGALIYFTGDDIFNRSIRLLSSKKGMRLNQRGLYQDVMRGPKRVKLNEGMLVEGADEKEIFRILGVPWRPPEQRVIR